MNSNEFYYLEYAKFALLLYKRACETKDSYMVSVVVQITDIITSSHYLWRRIEPQVEAVLSELLKLSGEAQRELDKTHPQQGVDLANVTIAGQAN